MSDEPGLLRAIADAPDDDTPRLVYADWLEDQGGAARAEFLRLQLQLEEMDRADERYPELLARSRRLGVLTGEAPAEWRTHVPGARVQLRRGLIDSVRIKAEDYLKAPAEAWAALPVKTLWLEPQEGAGPALAAREELSRVPGLVLEGWRPDDLGALSGPDHPKVPRFRQGLCE